MEQICYNCFQESLNEQGICTQCGFDGAENRQRYPLALPLGSILYGRYILGRVLGQGGFGITYLAQDFQTKGLVAVKEFFPDTMATRSGRATVMPLSGDQGENFSYGLQCFLEEAQTMAEFIGNPNIARVFCYFEENGTGYFVMEYLDGCSLLDYIKSHNGRLTWDEAMGIALPIMDALTAMHEKGIIHRDVTPDNIYITRDGQVKLLDFGAARHSLGNVSRSLDVILKHGFAPKEQYSRRGRQGPFTDVYSLGATIYYAITGVKPDDAIERSDEDNLPLPTNLGARISVAQEEALLKAMAVQTGDRYATMQDFKEALLTAQSLPKTESAPMLSQKPIPEPISAPIPAPVPQPVPVMQPEPVQSSEPVSAAEELAVQPPVKKKKRGKGLLIAACVTCLVAGATFVGAKTVLPDVLYNKAMTLAEAGKYSQAIFLYDFLGDSEAAAQAKNAKAYHEADVLAEKGENGKAAIAFGKLSGYRDARNRSMELWDIAARRDTISAGGYHSLGLKTDGTVVAAGDNLDNWANKVPDEEGQCNVGAWENIIAVCAGDYHSVGLKRDGTVVATGINDSGCCNVEDWTDIVAVSCGTEHSVGLKMDGTVVAVGSNEAGECDVSDWNNMIAVIAGQYYTIGIRDDNVILWTGVGNKGEYELEQELVQITTDGLMCVGLTKDGNAEMWNAFGTSIPYGLDVTGWSDLIDVDVKWAAFGVKSDGTVYACGFNEDGQGDVDNWTDIVDVSAGTRHTLGLKSDGTVVAAGDHSWKRCNISSWKDIKLPNKVQP